jgi:hypothetical protein
MPGAISRFALPSVDVVEINRFAPRPFVFTELALSLRDMLRAADCHAEHVLNKADPQHLSIVFVPTDGWQDVVGALDPARTVLFNMEQLGSNAPWTRGGYAESLAHWTVADYSSANIEYLKSFNGEAQRAHEIPIVPGPSVVFPLPPEKLPAAPSVDVLFFGTRNARREHILNGLRERGVSVEAVAGAYGWELTPAIRRARIVLHVHFYETRLFPVSRILQPVASEVPVVCETSVCPALSDWSRSGIVFADYDGLVEACVDLLASPQRRQESAQRSLRHARGIDSTGPLRALLEGLTA